MPDFFAYGFGLVEQPAAVLRAGADLTLEFTAPAGVSASANLFQGDQELPERVSLVERVGGRVRVHARFPRPGRYILRVYGRQGPAQGRFQAIAQFTVEAATGAGDHAEFPETSGAFERSGARDLVPLRAVVPVGQPVRFSVIVSGAAEVAVVDGGEHFHPLTRDGDRFKGAVVVPPGEVLLMAKLNPGGNSYQLLATYRAR